MLKKLKSLFVIEEPGSQKKSGKNVEVKDKQQEDPIVESTPQRTQVSTNVGPGKAKDKFLNVLFGAMDKANLDGFDYLEFKQFLKSLDKVPMDEATKFQSAYATAQTMGATVNVLKESAQHYIKVLQTEGKKFDQAVENQKKNNLSSKENHIKELKTIVSNKMKQITAMNKEIEAHKKKIESTSEEIASASKKVAITEKNFQASYDLVVGQIKTDIEKINSYLGGEKKPKDTNESK